jgi:hypothetical protein
MQEPLLRGFMPAMELATLWNFQLQLSPFYLARSNSFFGIS